MKQDKKNTGFQGIIELAERFPTEQACREYLAQIRWNGQPVCPHCGNFEKKIYVFQSRNLYKCTACKKQFTVTVGTIFEGTKISLRKWFHAVYLLTTSSKGISSIQLAKMMHVTQKTGWFLAHRIRYAVRTKSFWATPLKNVVEVDETYIGGKEGNKHADKKIKGSQGGANKIVVVGMIERGGKVIAQTTADSKAESLHPVVSQYVVSGSTLMTDEAMGYTGLNYRYTHKRINHKAGTYVIGDIHTNTIEGFWSIVKRGVIGVYHYISAKHADRYIDEYEYRYNNRKDCDKGKFDGTLINCRGRLKYKTLIAKS